MNEVKVSTADMFNGGVIEMWKLNGFYYVKAIVKGVVKFSEAVRKVDADYFVFDAVHHGELDF